MKPIPRMALLCLDGWAGRLDHPVTIIGETPGRYRIKAATKTRLAGRQRWLYPGKTALVPKYAIRELEQEK